MILGQNQTNDELFTVSCHGDYALVMSQPFWGSCSAMFSLTITDIRKNRRNVNTSSVENKCVYNKVFRKVSANIGI